MFHTAPDLLEDFKQFLPESAAQAKAQAAARAAADEAMISNVRGEYTAGQIAQAQTPRPTTKMPPMGQFDPPSTSKENKKRRGGLGVQSSSQAGPSSSLDVIGTAQSGRGGAVQIGNVNKVSEYSISAWTMSLVMNLHSIILTSLSFVHQLASYQPTYINPCSPSFLTISLLRNRTTDPRYAP